MFGYFWGGFKQGAGVVKGFGEGLVDTGKGLVGLVGVAASCTDFGGQARCLEFAGGVVDLGAAFVDDPVDTGYTMLLGFLKPIHDEFAAGNYGEGIGRGFEIGFEIVAGGAAARSARATKPATLLDDLARTPSMR